MKYSLIECTRLTSISGTWQCISHTANGLQTADDEMTIIAITWTHRAKCFHMIFVYSFNVRIVSDGWWCDGMMLVSHIRSTQYIIWTHRAEYSRENLVGNERRNNRNKNKVSIQCSALDCVAIRLRVLNFYCFTGGPTCVPADFLTYTHTSCNGHSITHENALRLFSWSLSVRFLCKSLIDK